MPSVATYRDLYVILPSKDDDKENDVISVVIDPYFESSLVLVRLDRFVDFLLQDVGGKVS